MGNALRKEATFEKPARSVAMSNILKTLMTECGIDGAQLAKNTGLTRATIYRWLNQTSCNPSLSSLEAVAAFFSIPVSQLIGDEPITNREKGKFSPNTDLWVKIPLLAWEQTESWNGDIDKLDASVEFISTDLYLSPFAFAVKMKGDSMEPRFPEGTTLIFDPKCELENKNYALVLLENQKLPIFKQVLIDGENIYLRSLNEYFDNSQQKILRQDKGDKILGIMIQSRNDFIKPQIP